MKRGVTKEDTITRSPQPSETFVKTRVEVVEGQDAGVVMELSHESVLVGSGNDCDLALTDPAVSRRHCTFTPTPGGLEIRDEDSTNGIYMEGLRLYRLLATREVTIRLGATTIRVLPLADRVVLAQPFRTRFGGLIGASARMRELFADLERIAATDISVLVEGATGTGKELVAETIHEHSARREKPFVVFDCAACAPTLIESSLFGHERGAFTGAIQARAGCFQEAHGGTLFIDEVGELPRELQPRLLRALDKQEVRRLGADKSVRVDVRVIAATNRNLRREVKANRFREDLYHRLLAARVRIPPLRDRMQDLPLLVDHFSGQLLGEKTELPPGLWTLLRSHHWPGNVRELKNAIARFAVLPERVLRDGYDWSQSESSTASITKPLGEARREALEKFEKEYVSALLALTDGNITRAANHAGVSRQMIQKLRRKYDLS